MIVNKKPFKLLKLTAYFCKLEDLLTFFKSVSDLSENKSIEVFAQHGNPGEGNLLRVDIPLKIIWAEREPSVEDTKQKIQKDKADSPDIKSQPYNVEEIIFYLKSEIKLYKI